MNKSACAIFSLLTFLLITSDICGQTSDQWHYPLYLSNMGYWHSRILVTVKNSSTHEALGEPVIFTIGKGVGQLHLTGEDVSGVRVTDSFGTELLCRITSPQGGLVTDGRIPDNSLFILPVKVKGGQSE